MPVRKDINSRAHRAQVWRDVVSTTSAAGDNLACSLRVLLWLAAFREPHFSPRRSLLVFGASLWNLVRPVRPAPGDSGDGRILVCMPHTTRACLANMVPVAKEALARGRLGGLVLANPNAPEFGEFRRLAPIITFRDLLLNSTRSERVRALKRALRTHRTLVARMERHAPMLVHHLRQNALYWVSELGCSAILEAQCRGLLQRWRPEALVTSSDFLPSEFQLTDQACGLGIPTAVVQHGVIDPFWWPFRADYDLVWGEPFRDELVAMGAPWDRIVVCGMPATDRSFAQGGAGGRTTSRVTEPTCLILSNTNARVTEPDVYDAFRRLLEDTVVVTDFVKWVVKLHPSEDGAFYRGLSTALQNRIEILPRHVQLEDAITSATVVCTVNSTAGLEAMIMQRPVVVLNVTPAVEEVAWWPNSGGGVYAGTREKLLHAIRGLLCDGTCRDEQLARQDAFLSKVFANPGRAAAAVVDFLEEARVKRAP